MKNKVFWMGALVVLLLAVGATWAYAQSEGVIRACADTTNGKLRLVTDSTACRKANETYVEWNIVGPPGPPGPRGPAGVANFYYAAQDRKTLQPGEFGLVQSWCDMGDFAISGAIVIYADDFNLQFSVPVIHDGQYSWALQGINEGATDAEIRVSAVCADLTE